MIFCIKQVCVKRGRANRLNTRSLTLRICVKAHPAPKKLTVSSTADLPGCTSFGNLTAKAVQRDEQELTPAMVALCAKL